MSLGVYGGFRDIPAFEFLDGPTGAGIRGVAPRLEASADDLRRAGTVELPSAGTGVTVNRAIEILGEARQRADRTVDRHLRIAAAVEAARAAAKAFLKTSPTDAEPELPPPRRTTRRR